MKMKIGVLVSLVLVLSAAGVRGQDWPQWRGPHRDNKVTGFIEPKTWPKELRQKWKVTVGLGESSPVLVGNKIYAFSRQGGDEVTLCLDADSGKELWKDNNGVASVKGPSAKLHSGPRSTPAVAEGKICTLGVDGVVSCLDAASGKVIWRKETKSMPKFYTSTSPLITDGKCIVFVDGLTAFDLANGEPKWQWKGGEAPYGSPVLMTMDGTKAIVTPSTTSLAGIALADGKLLWEAKLPTGGYQNNYSTPVINGHNVIYSVALKGSGSETMALKIEKKSGGFAAGEIWKSKLASDKYYSPVLKDNLLFGVSTDRKIFCLEAKNGEQLWTDSTKRGECGHVLNAGNVMLALSSDAQLIAFAPSNKEYKELASYKVSEKTGNEGPWSCPIVAGNRIYVRDNAGTLALWTID